MTEYQERRAQYLRDAHDWAEDDQPDGSADYSTVTVTVEADATGFMDAMAEAPTSESTTSAVRSGWMLGPIPKANAHAEEIRKAYLRGYTQGNADGYEQGLAAGRVEALDAS